MTGHNPYAPPAAEVTAEAGVPVQGEPQPWEVGEAIRSGWEIYKANWAPLTLGYFVATLVGTIPGQVAPALQLAGVFEEGSFSYYLVHAPLSLVGWLVAEFFAVGFTRAALRATRLGTATFGDFFAGGSRFVAFLVMSFVKTVVVFVGLLFLVVPGIIVALGLMNSGFYVVDQNLGPIASLKASWVSAEGQKSNLLVLALAEVGLTLVGLAACCLGVFVAVPAMLVARAIVYTRMSGTAEPPSPPAGGPGCGPPGGYGPPGYGPPPGYGALPGYGSPPSYGPPG